MYKKIRHGIIKKKALLKPFTILANVALIEIKDNV